MQSEKLTVTTHGMVAVLLIAAAAVSGACSGLIDELPTTPDPVISTETASGTLTVNGGQTHPFFTSATGPIVATLTSLGEAPADTTIGFSLGTLAGASCNIVLANDQALVSSVLNGTVSTLGGRLCVRVYDVGRLTGPVEYTFTVSHP
jgi:hypothetical protein